MIKDKHSHSFTQYKLFMIERSDNHLRTGKIRYPYIEHAASGLHNHTHLEARYDLSRLEASRLPYVVRVCIQVGIDKRNDQALFNILPCMSVTPSG